jgi:hypothetical protein
VGHGGALGALDQGLEAVWVAVDCGRMLQRRSGEARWSGKEMAVEMWVWLWQNRLNYSGLSALVISI